MDKPPSPSHAAASIAMRVLRAVLEDSAKNGKVSMADIDRSIALIERGTVELDQAYAAARQRFEAEEQDKKSTEDDASASPQKRFWMRSDPLHRLLVRPFESMFFTDPPTFSRKYLPPYFDAARQFIGADMVTYDNECKAIIQSLLANEGSRLNWDMVYADGRTLALMRRVCGLVVRQIGDDDGWDLWHSLMAKPAADGSMPNDAMLRAVRDHLCTFVRSFSSAA